VAGAALLLGGVLAAGPLYGAKHVTTTANLSFGRFAAAGGGSISIGANGTRTGSGAVILLASSVGAARFTISGNGDDNRIAILTLPPNGSVRMSSGPNRMAVNDFISSDGGSGLLAAATDTVTVGATLQVEPNQRPGNYSGTFHVTLEYQ